MRSALAAGLIAAAALSPWAAQASGPGLFCLDRVELAAERDRASPVVKQVLYGPNGSFGVLLAAYERTLDSAARGDRDAQRKIGGYWAACVLKGDAMSAPKLSTAATYLRTAADAGDKQAQMYLGQFYALGAGVPADYAQAYRLVVASGQPADAAERFASGFALNQASESERQAAWIYGQMLSALLKSQLEPIARQVVADEAVGKTLAASVAFRTCPNNAEVLQAADGLKRDVLQPFMQTLAQRLPSAGLPCTHDTGKPFGFVVPFNIIRPD